jgi:hypothetical protein
MEKFNYENVNTKMTELTRVFTELMDMLDKLNIELNDNVSIGDEAAIHGATATQLLDSWNSCSDTFVNFRKTYDGLCNLVSIVGQNNKTFEEAAIALYSGSSMEG